jgi:DNA-binding transcriptional LysR family regulator
MTFASEGKMTNLLGETPGLIAFVRTVEAGSFSAAARYLNTTPSVVSRSVGRLETLIGSRLFLRSTRALTLTSEGQALVGRIAPLLRELDAAADEIETAQGPSGRVRFSMPSEFSRLLMEPVLAHFAPANPNISLDIGLTDRFVDIIREDYDVAFRVGDIKQPDLIVRHLADFDMVLVASPSFIDRWGHPTSAAEFNEVPFARYALNGQIKSIVLRDGAEIIPTGRIDCDTGFALHAAARHGLGVAYMMRCVVAEDIRTGELIDLTPHNAFAPLAFNAVHAFGRTVPRRVTVFCEFVAREAQGLNLL